MTLLDIGGSGLSMNSAGFLHVLGTVLKLAAGSVIILMMAFMSVIGSIIYSVYDGYQKQSILEGARTLIHFTAYAIGVSVALVFALVVGLLFSMTVAKLLFVAVLIAFTVGIIMRETFLFLVLKRFGKYLMYFTALQYIKETVYPNGEQENQP